MTNEPKKELEKQYYLSIPTIIVDRIRLDAQNELIKEIEKKFDISENLGFFKWEEFKKQKGVE